MSSSNNISGQDTNENRDYVSGNDRIHPALVFSCTGNIHRKTVKQLENIELPTTNSLSTNPQMTNKKQKTDLN